MVAASVSASDGASVFSRFEKRRRDRGRGQPGPDEQPRRRSWHLRSGDVGVGIRLRPQAFVAHVARDTHDGPRVVVPRDPPTDRMAVRKGLPRESLADDEDARSGSGVGRQEAAPAHDGHAHDVEIPGRHHIEMRHGPGAGAQGLPWPGVGVTPVPRRERNEHRVCRGLDTWQGGGNVGQVVLKRQHGGRTLLDTRRQRRADCDNSVERKARIDRGEVRERAQQQGAADEEYRRQRDLDDEEHGGNPAVIATHARSLTATERAADDDGAQSANLRRRSQQQRAERDQGRRNEHVGIDANVGGQREVARVPGHQGTRQRPRHGRSGRARNQEKGDVLGPELTDQSSA